MEGSRIWIDLSALCTGARKQSCIYLDYEKLKNVQDVQDHIRRVFDIDGRINIFNEGWLIPPSESSRLLRDNDIVSVQDAESKCLSHSDRNESLTSTIPHTAFNQDDKSGLGAVTDTTSTDGNTKGSALSSITVTIPNNQERPSSTHSSLNDPIRKVSVKVPAERTNTPPNDFVSSPSTNQDNDSNTNFSGNESVKDGEPKRKRVRRRKRKNNDLMNTDDSSKPKEIRQSPYIMNKILQGVSHILNTSVADPNKKHIFFKEPVENLDESNGEVAANGSHTAPTTSCDDAQGDLSKLLSFARQRTPVVFERQKPQNNKANGLHAPEKAKTGSNIKFSPLTSIPVKGTVIMFKILKMVNYSPTVSENITAKVVSPDHESGRLYVHITDGLNEMRSEKGKFCLDAEEEDEIPSEYTFLEWRDLLEPKAVEIC